MKNVSHSPVTEMLSGRHKIWLMIGLALLPIADLSACIALWVFGAAGAYWGLPFVMTLVDLAYLLCVALSNQRFKYAQKMFAVYILITIVLFIIWISEFAGSSEVMLANTVEVYSGLLHVVGIAAVAISYLYASRRLRMGRRVQFVLAVAFSAVLLLAFVVIYGVFVISDGYFGQGHGNLPLVYSYIGDSECEVTDVVYGNGDSVVIPYEFNGRKVTSVSYKVFTYANIKSVTLNCDSNIELCKDISSSLNTNITIYADKKAVDTIKKKFYSRNSTDSYYGYQFALGNNVRPIGLSKDEVYVTFNYDRDAYDTAQGSVIPTWYGKKGETFKLSDIDGMDYAQHSDVNNDDDLFYCYNNVGYKGGFIMTELQDGGKAIDGMTIDKSRNNVPVRFQKIYKVFAGKSNDDKYDTDEHFSFSTVQGIKQDFKLTVTATADELLLPFDRGEAFTRTMKYEYSSNGNITYRTFTSLSALLSVGLNEVTIAPYWELVKPQIALSSVTDEADIIYGDDFELTASVTHPIDGVQVEYEWYDDVQRIGYEQDLQMNASTTGMFTYTAIVKISAPAVTSLTTANAAEIRVNVNKRPLTVTWEHKSLEALGGDEPQTYGTESVYDCKQRTIQPRAQNLAYDDYIFFTGYTVLDAGTDTVSATLGSYWDEKYYIAEGETYTYTIKPCPVPLTWDERTEFVYDGKPHTPTAIAYDLGGQGLIVNCSSAEVNVGDYSVTALKFFDSNYVISDSSTKTITYKITPKPVITLWGSVQLTYNGNVQAPEASATGVDGETVATSVTGGQTNVNVVNGNKTAIYTATATSANKNYTLTGSTSMEYTIEPYGVTVTWTNTTVTYNGQSQLPTATAVGVNNQAVPVTVAIEDFPTGAINVDDYTATATIANTNYCISSGDTHAFTITPMEVRVDWGIMDFTYNGSEQKPNATAKGANGEDLPLTVRTMFPSPQYPEKDGKCGSNVATAALATENPNYTLTNSTKGFSIARKKLTAVIQDVTVEYGQTVDVDFTIDGVLDGDDVTAIPTAKYTLDEDGNVPVGEYDIIIQLDGADKDCYEIVVVRQGKLTVTQPDETED